MDNHILELVKKMKRSNLREEDTTMRCGDETVPITYQVIEADETKLRIWNSSNSQSVNNLSDVLDDIRTEILDGEMGGSLSDGWNEIMWEIIE